MRVIGSPERELDLAKMATLGLHRAPSAMGTVLFTRQTHMDHDTSMGSHSGAEVGRAK